MKLSAPRLTTRSSTRTDVLIVVLTIVLLTAFFLPKLGGSRRSKRVMCLQNLKQVTTSFRMWAVDHDDKFPWLVSTNQGGSMEYVNSADVFRHFLVTSNQLSSPKILICAQERSRIPAPSFDRTFNNRNLSYFIGLDADETQPQSLLFGDRTISTNAQLLSGLLTLSNSSPVSWAKGLHAEGGNVVLGDGSMQQMSDVMLKRWVDASNDLPARLAIP